MANELVITGTTSLIPAAVAAAGENAAKRFVEYFTANIRNRNTRVAYAKAVSDFFRWCEALTFTSSDRLSLCMWLHTSSSWGRHTQPQA